MPFPENEHCPINDGYCISYSNMRKWAMPKVETLVTAAEVATCLGVDRSIVLRMVHSGRLSPVVKLPGKTGSYLFSRESIELEKSKRTVRAVRRP